MDTAMSLLAAGVVIVVVRLMGWIGGRLGQPAVIGEIIAGILLGPSLLGALWPAARAAIFPDEVTAGLQVLAQFGLVLFMLLVGQEFDGRLLHGQGRKVAVISIGSMVLPFGLGAGLGALLYGWFDHGQGRLTFSLFFGAAIAITAFPVLARILQETGLYHTRVGAIAIACAAVNDVIAWCSLAVVVAVAASDGAGDIALRVGVSLAFVLVMLKVVRPLLARARNLPLWTVLVVAFLSAWVTESIGIHAVFGAFLAGVVMPRDEHWQQHVRLRLEAVVMGFVLPMFFVVAGMSTRLDRLGSWSLGVLAVVTVVAVVGKLGGAAIAARAVGEGWPTSVALGVLVNSRGLTEIVILTVGLQLGIIDTTLFTIMVLMALVTTVMTEPTLRLLSRRFGAVSASLTPVGPGGRVAPAEAADSPAP